MFVCNMSTITLAPWIHLWVFLILYVPVISALMPPMQTATVPMKCDWRGVSTCCSLVEKTNSSYSRQSQNFMHSNHLHGRSHFIGKRESNRCNTTRVYIPSSYESSHINKAIEISTIAKLEDRIHVLEMFIEQDIPNTNKWLQRILFHMIRDHQADYEHNNDDYQYLSRYETRIDCDGQYHSSVEWIEPITVHARHPNSLIQHCRPLAKMWNRTKSLIEYPVKHLINSDYLLLEHKEDYIHKLGTHVSHQHRSILFDAGAGYFDTGTAWLACGYHQVSNRLLSLLF